MPPLAAGNLVINCLKDIRCWNSRAVSNEVI
jgi:hypothetical protein